MPRKKTAAPQRMTEEERNSSTWRMGDQLQTINLPSDDESDDPDFQPFTSAAAAANSSRNCRTSDRPREYQVIIDDDDDEEEPEDATEHQQSAIYISSEDEDAVRPSARTKAGTKKAPKKKRGKSSTVAAASNSSIDLELEDLKEDASFFIDVRSELTLGRSKEDSADTATPGRSDWWSPIAKVDLHIDLERHNVSSKLVLPDRPEFRLYLSEIPGRSFIYYEWYDQKPGETQLRFEKRQKVEAPDNIMYYHIKDPENMKILRAFSVKQKVLQLKFYKYFEFSGQLDLKVCITSQSLVKLTHPSDHFVRVPTVVINALDACFPKEGDLGNAAQQDEEDDEESNNLNHDIDALYEVVKQYHIKHKSGREERIKVNPQHRSLLPKLRPYQSDAVRWMLEKEDYLRNLDDDLKMETDALHSLYEEVVSHDGTRLFFNRYAGYLVLERPVCIPAPPGGILADEMGLGKTVEVLACMLNNPRPNVEKPPYLEPIIIEQKKNKRSRRKRSPSPIEFFIHDEEASEQPRIDSDVLKQPKGPSPPPVAKSPEPFKSAQNGQPIVTAEFSDDDKEQSDPDFDINQVDGIDDVELKSDNSEMTDGGHHGHKQCMEEAETGDASTNLSRTKNIQQLDGTGDTSEEDAISINDHSSDSDFVPEENNSSRAGPSSSRRPARRSKDKTEQRAIRSLSRKFSEKRTVYYHEEFDSMSSDDEVMPTPKKRAKRKSSVEADSKAKKQKSKAKTIDTRKPVLDADFPTYSPFPDGRNAPTTSESRQAPAMIVKCLADLAAKGDAGYRAGGVSIQRLKKMIKNEFNKDFDNVKAKAKFVEAINQGVESGQLIKTSLGTGATGSIALNPHFNPDDSRGIYATKEDPLDQVIEQVITDKCYDGAAHQKPHVPERFAKMINDKKDKSGEKKGSMYSKLKSLYEQSLPMSLAEYATDKRSTEWRRSYFKTKVEQQSFFECLCGSTEENREKVGYRVQCTKCKAEQHADCVKYDITDPYRGEYMCPHCWVASDKIKSGATLIVSPTSISFQWIEEMQKHIRHRDIKMFYYKGAKEMGYIQPRKLADGYDIVVTTYEVLTAETNYVDVPHSNSAEGRRFRNPKRFLAMPSPLTCVEWWRICLDEAQMIESTTKRTAEMALRLSAVNRWCVTGTPIGRSVNDLQGLMMFLKVDPFSVEFWWRNYAYRPYCAAQQRRLSSDRHESPQEETALENLLCSMLWRTVKADVLDQIDIPSQSNETHWLQFSPVEEHFYRRQHIDVSRSMSTALARHLATLRLSHLDRAALAALLTPLLRLRQSCCHPQAVRGQFMNMSKQTSTMTMEQLLEQLIKKASNEAEEALRKLIMALNGLAGLDIIEEKFVDAVDKYREILRVSAEQKERCSLKTDTLQLLHTTTNLAELLEAGHLGIGRTLREDGPEELRDESARLRERYMNKHFGGVEGSKAAVEPVTVQVEACLVALDIKGASKKVTSSVPWYQKVIDWVDETGQEPALLKLVHDELAQFFDVANEKEFREIQAKYPSSRLVMYKLADKLETIINSRTKVEKDMEELMQSDITSYFNAAVDCHLRESTKGIKHKKKCRLCQVHDDIEEYENILFHFIKGEIKGSRGPNRATVTEEERKTLEAAGVFLHDEQRRGTWAESEGERLCRAVVKFARVRNSFFEESVLGDANNQIKLLDLLKKEFRLTRIYWRQLFDQVAGVDEVNMSTQRLRLRFDDEPVTAAAALKQHKKPAGHPDLSTRTFNKMETGYILEKYEVEPERLKFIALRASSRAEMTKFIGQLLYLTNLKNTDYGKKGGHNPEPCPICQKELGTQWSVLQCGHCYCVECIRILIDEYTTGRSVKCAVCRSFTAHSEISYVSTKNEEKDQFVIEDIKGSHSTKVEAVVKTLMKINADDSGSKSLVFSVWTDVLDIIAAALDENDIPYATLHSGSTTNTKSKFKRNIQKFKNREDVKVLLMPVSSGANGLNLVEANHVLLVEPVLNPAQELQAIGRVHRIGQKKATVVHRFYVRNTIEERIHQMMKIYHREHKKEEQGSHSTEENLLTIQDLKNLFFDQASPDPDGEPIDLDPEHGGSAEAASSQGTTAMPSDAHGGDEEGGGNEEADEALAEMADDGDQVNDDQEEAVDDLSQEDSN